MVRLPRATAKQMSKALTKLGFSLDRQSGSHAIYKNVQGLRATIPVHGNTILHPKIIKTILKDIGISAESLKDLL